VPALVLVALLLLLLLLLLLARRVCGTARRRGLSTARRCLGAQL
jgi:hypothetical protein